MINRNNCSNEQNIKEFSFNQKETTITEIEQMCKKYKLYQKLKEKLR